MAVQNQQSLRVPPHSQEAEESVLGAMLIDKDAVIAVAEFLLPEDFYDERLRDIYQACLDLYEERGPIDVLTVTERLKKRKTLKNVGGSSFLADLANKVPTAAHVEHYGRIVKDTATKRSLMSAATRLVEVSMDEGLAANEALDKAESEIFSLSQRSLSKTFTSVRDTLAESFDRLDELHKSGAGIRGVPTGFPDLDDALAGLQKSNLIILAARPGVGKCVTGDTLIVDPITGKRQTIEDIVSCKNGSVSTLGNNFKIIRKVKPLAFIDDGKKEVYEIKTALGNKLEATAVHPLLTIDGWKRIEELKAGARVAVPRKMEFFGNKNWDDWKIKTLAYILGDSCVTTSSPKFTNSNPSLLYDFNESTKKFGLDKFFGEEPEKIDRTNPVTSWLISQGIMGKLSIEKDIPAEVFELNRKNLALFLNRLFACEGSVILAKIKGTGRISFSSSSYKLIEGVRHLLLRFAILTRLREKRVRYKNEFKTAYELEIMGAENILTFIREIGVFGKEDALGKMKKLAKVKKDSKNWSKDTLPMGIWKLVLEEKGNITWREIYRRMGRSPTHNIHANRRQLKRETLREIALSINSKKLLALAESDLYWDKIVSIKSSGIKQVYDLTIDKTHNFIANDIVVHNTSLAMNIAQYVAVELKRPVGFFSLEMSREELVDRLLVAQADIDAWKLKTGKLSEDDFTKLSNAMGVLAEAPLFIDDTPGLSILEMRTKARRLQVENGLDLLIVDYLQLARSRNLENRVQEVSEISQGLKNLARELKIPVFALSQLSRAVETRGGKKPQLSDLRDSGSIEQDSDVVMFLWREDDDNIENMMLDIAKHRNGPLRSIPLHFKGDRIRFYSRDTKHTK